MDFTSILTAVAPFVLEALKGALAHVTPNAPPPTPTTVPAGTTPYPREFIMSVQTFANKVIAFIDPSAAPLKVDGWAGEKTKAALNTILAYASSHGLG